MNPVTLKSKDLVLRAEELAEGIVHIHLTNLFARVIGFGASCYLVDDLLIDCGFSNARIVLARFLEGKRIRAICCTHNHEDHAGNCGRLAARFGCPVYLFRPDRLWDEGVANLLPYRRFVWGQPDAYRPKDMPESISTGSRTLRAIPTPGHSQTHAVFFEENEGFLFVGDLLVNQAAGAVMTYENPFESIRSLRLAAGLKAGTILNGHGLVIGGAQRRLDEKADRIESAADRVLGLHTRGYSTRQILREVFTEGRLKDWFFSKVTNGEFSRANFVRACIRHQRQSGD